MNFESLVDHISQVQDVLQAQAAHAVNYIQRNHLSQLLSKMIQIGGCIRQFGGVEYTARKALFFGLTFRAYYC